MTFNDVYIRSLPAIVLETLDLFSFGSFRFWAPFIHSEPRLMAAVALVATAFSTRSNKSARWLIIKSRLPTPPFTKEGKKRLLPSNMYT